MTPEGEGSLSLMFYLTGVGLLVLRLCSRYSTKAMSE